MGEKLLNWLNSEIEKHKESTDIAKSYDRGFMEGSLAEALSIRAKLREFMLKKRR